MRNKIEWFDDYYRYKENYISFVNKDTKFILEEIEANFPINDFVKISSLIILLSISEIGNEFYDIKVIDSLLLTKHEITKFNFKAKDDPLIIKSKLETENVTNINILNIL